MEITATQLAENISNGISYQLIDVREDFEFEICAIANSKLIPLSEFTTKYKEIDANLNTVMICHHGVRSAQAINFLHSKGFNNLLNLKGGIHAWATQLDNNMKTY